MLFWLLIAIIVAGGAAAIVNDAAYDGRLFNSWTVISVAMLAALTLFVGRGLVRESTTSERLLHALIWAAIVLAVALLYRVAPIVGAL